IRVAKRSPSWSLLQDDFGCCPPDDQLRGPGHVASTEHLPAFSLQRFRRCIGSRGPRKSSMQSDVLDIGTREGGCASLGLARGWFLRVGERLMECYSRANTMSRQTVVDHEGKMLHALECLFLLSVAVNYFAQESTTPVLRSVLPHFMLAPARRIGPAYRPIDQKSTALEQLRQELANSIHIIKFRTSNLRVTSREELNIDGEYYINISIITPP
ncbi:unnamed protein product, partial [Pleuronectes platessa]